MRAPVLALAALLLVPTALAAWTWERPYVMHAAGCRDGLVQQNCATFFPALEWSAIDARAEDVSGASVRVRVCHEWTYDDGSHARVRCSAACDAFAGALDPPPWRHNTTYRVIVDLRGGPAGCEAAATAGTLRVTFT